MEVELLPKSKEWNIETAKLRGHIDRIADFLCVSKAILEAIRSDATLRRRNSSHNLNSARSSGRCVECIRLWRTDVAEDDGRPFWIGAATYDAGVGFSHVSGALTHHTASDIDSERKFIFDCIEKANGFTTITFTPR